MKELSDGTATGRAAASSTSSVPIPTPHTRRSRTVDLPYKFSSKILIAFLEGDDSVIWCKKLFPQNVDFSYDASGEATMSITFALDRRYDD